VIPPAAVFLLLTAMVRYIMVLFQTAQ